MRNPSATQESEVADPEVLEPEAADIPTDPATIDDTDVKWLDHEEQLAWRAWIRAYRLTMLAIDDSLMGTGLRMGEYEILAMLSEVPDRTLRMSALADQVVQSRSRLTHTAKRLEAMGLARRAKIIGDGRGVEVTLTDAGYQLVSRVAPSHLVAVRERFMDHMSREDLLNLGDGMRRVILANRARPEQGSDAF
ncbi:MAG: MarR family transcriptional regulator [Ornithinimicrobium sp.]